MVTHLDIDTLRARVERGDPWPQVPVTGIGIGPSLELACSLDQWRNVTDPVAELPRIEAWASNVDALVDARRALSGVESNVLESETPVREFWPLGSRPALDRARATFLLRFRRSLRERARFSGNAAMAIAMAAFEMADNTIQHSGVDVDHAAAGAVGFEVHPDRICFAVADRGRGVLASLTSSPRWRHITSPRDALEAAVLRGASSRRDGDGGGFRDLSSALADLSGNLRFASDDVVLHLDGRDHSQRVQRRGTRSWLSGFQLSVEMRIS
jgi:hypothetical protein